MRLYGSEFCGPFPEADSGPATALLSAALGGKPCGTFRFPLWWAVVCLN